MKVERVDTKSNEARAMELEAQMFEVEMTIARNIWRENALESELAETEEREQRGGIKGGEHVWLLA